MTETREDRGMTLTEFLEARIAEDEEAARLGISGQADPENGWGYVSRSVSGDGGALTPHVGVIHEAIQAAHIIRWHPARVLAECDAKRRIVAEFEGYERTAAAMDDRGDADGYEVAEAYSGALWHLATVWADHPDYDESWRP